MRVDYSKLWLTSSDYCLVAPWLGRALLFTLRIAGPLQVKPLDRFLADLPVSGGAWLLVPGGAWRAAQPSERISSCDNEVVAPCAAVRCLTPDATQLADVGWNPFGSGAACGGGAAGQEATAVEGQGPSAAALRAAAAARAGEIASLRCLALDVLLAAPDGADRCVPRDLPACLLLLGPPDVLCC